MLILGMRLCSPQSQLAVGHLHKSYLRLFFGSVALILLRFQFLTVAERGHRLCDAMLNASILSTIVAGIVREGSVRQRLS